MLFRFNRLSPRFASPLVAFALCVAGASVSSGCAVNQRPKTTIPRLLADADTARVVERALRDTVIERLVRRARARGDGTLDVLMLSGGGQNGAFGVGFLRGWSERADDAMPRFDMVTGISTGALQAPYALLGTRSALDTVAALYRRAAERIAPSFDWLFLARRTGGIVSTKKYDRALEQSVSGAFRSALQQAFAEDRQLLFGTADFDTGVGRTWSLGDILDSSDASLGRARSLLKAATAIPGIFPPVVIDGHVHADGGTISNVLPVLRFEDYQRLAARLAAAGMGDVTVRVYVVMNVWTHAPPQVVGASNRRAVSSRANALMFFSHQPETLAGLADLARAVNGGIQGLRMQYRAALLPASEALEPGARKLFDRAFMQRLEEIGAAKARSATPWDMIPSAYERPPRSRLP